MKKLVFFLWLITGCTITPPLVIPSPSPVANLLSISANAEKPYAGKEPSFATQQSVTIAKGETRGFWMKLTQSSCTSMTAVTPNGVSVQIFSAPPITTKTPSFIGAPLTNYDPLIPLQGSQACGGYYFVDVIASQSAESGVITFSANFSVAALTVRVINFTMPVKPSLPIYMELTSHTLLGAHNLADTVANQGPITKKYVDFYRAHRIEPIKQAINSYPQQNAGGSLNLDQWSQYGGSFRQLVLDGALAPPCLFGPLPSLPPSNSLLSELSTGLSSGSLPQDSWAYAWDEGEGDAAATSSALKRVNLIHQYAPNLSIRTTRQEDPAFSAVTSFIPVLDWLKQIGHVQAYSKSFGGYVSCMSQGNCINGSVGTPSGTPMMVLDAPSVNPLAFPIITGQMGGVYALYYSGTQMLGTAFSDAYYAGGNGDGTLLYPDVKNIAPLASVRLKLLRESSFFLEYAKLKPNAFAALIQDTKHWSKSYSDYQVIRDQIAGAM